MSFACCVSHAIHFPTEKDFAKNYIVVSRDEGKQVELLSKKKSPETRIFLNWNKGELEEIKYVQATSFTDHQLSELSRIYGQGAQWLETPVDSQVKAQLGKSFAGLQQQWNLNGYNKEKGWMAAGLNENLFYIVFRKSSPLNFAPPKKPLAISGNLKQLLNKSGVWLKSKCTTPKQGSICFTSIINSSISLETRDNFNTVISSIKENSPLQDVQSAIHNLTRDKYQEYSRDLQDMSKLEGQNAILKFANEIPELFNWKPYQIQNQNIGLIKAARYNAIFMEKKTQWPNIPIFEFENKMCKISIHLLFNGHYYLTATRLTGVK